MGVEAHLIAGVRYKKWESPEGDSGFAIDKLIDGDFTLHLSDRSYHDPEQWSRLFEIPRIITEDEFIKAMWMKSRADTPENVASIGVDSIPQEIDVPPALAHLDKGDVRRYGAVLDSEVTKMEDKIKRKKVELTFIELEDDT